MRLILAIAVLMTTLVLGATATRAALVSGTAGNDALKGTAEHDELYGRAGNDTLDGAGDDDDLDGGPGADDLRGGAGDDDAVGYDGVTGVRVSLDGRADDGAPGEGDNARPDVEHVYTGRGADTLVGSRARNTLDAGDGGDRLDGGRGPDALFGGSGTDILDGGSGADSLDCGAGGTDVAVRSAADSVKRCEFLVRSAPRPGSVLAPAKGSFHLGGGVSQKAGCRGKVRMAVLRGRRRLASATVEVDGRCRYRNVFVLPGRDVGTATRLDLAARFLGNPVQGPRTFPVEKGKVPVIRLDQGSASASRDCACRRR